MMAALCHLVDNKAQGLGYDGMLEDHKHLYLRKTFQTHIVVLGCLVVVVVRIHDDD
jgi:hypothetical protein